MSVVNRRQGLIGPHAANHGREVEVVVVVGGEIPHTTSSGSHNWCSFSLIRAINAYRVSGIVLKLRPNTFRIVPVED